MRQDLKDHLARVITAGHRHQEMKDWLLCPRCGTKYKEWETERNRLKKLYPEEFKRT